MATDRVRPTIRRKGVWVLGAAAALVVVGGLASAWVLSRPTVSKFCVGGAPIDEVGAATPEAARRRWSSQYPSEYEIERPERTSVSGDRATAIYLLPTPEVDWANPDHTYFRQIVTERGDDEVWRVVGASRCEQWSGT